MASQYPPKKNTQFTLYFTLYKNDGTIIANPGTITKKVSIDGGAVADITASVTEENTTYGQCSLVLSSDEMNGDAIWVYIADDTSGCIPFTVTLYTAANTQDAIGTAVDLVEDILKNKMAITDANGNVVLYADNNTDALFSVAGGVTDNLTTTIRKRLE